VTREADDLDAASELTQQLNDAYVTNARAKARPEQVQNADGTWPKTECDCGDPIPEGRLAMGKIRCLECQKDFEKGLR
jgi:RNA polymerase-binding transcription factor DksA